MSRYGSPNVDAVLVGGYNLVAYLTSIGSVRKGAVLEERTALNDDWRKHGDTTLREYSMGPYEGWYDDTATTGILARIDAELGTTAVICELRDTNTIGKSFVGMADAWFENFERMITVGESHKVSVTFAGSAEQDNGIILHALSTETANFDTEGASSQDAGASSSAGGAGYVQLTELALDTATNLALFVRHSADDVTYANLVTFTPRTAIGAERKAVTGTVNRHLAVKGTWTGGAGASSSATVMIGFARY